MLTDPQGSTADAIVSCLLAAAAGIAAFALLWWLATPHVVEREPAPSGLGPTVPPASAPAAVPAPPPAPAGSKIRQTIVDRRGFLVGVAGVIVVTGSATALSRRVRSESSVNTARRSTVLPRPMRSVLPPSSQPFDVDGLTPYVVPNGDFYRIDTALLVPQVASDGWTLSIKGMVDQPFTLTYDELLAMDNVEETVTIACVSNNVGGHLVGNAVWQGVPLTALLERAGVQAGAEQIVGRSTDGFTAGFPVAAALDGRTALVAYAMNGEPLPADHGYPARLIVAGLYGYVSATKWLSEIELTTWDDVHAYWTTRGWAREAPVKTATRIDVPSSDGDLAAGTQPIAGVSWAPDRGISKVEVRVDDGEWQECELGRVASDDTWVQWHYAWDATPGDHTIVARATDRDGVTQTEDVAPPAPDGATGWPHRDCRVR
jgi:DMSO/TMAO reductase YedYZ molybdopterin-dependent catalytic subunit